jgi:uncharacterized protein YciI
MTLADPPQVVNTAAIPHSSRSYVLLVNYTADLAAIDAEMPAHQRFLDQHVASGEFLVSGPRDPRTGGVILAHTISDARVAQIIATDRSSSRVWSPTKSSGFIQLAARWPFHCAMPSNHPTRLSNTCIDHHSAWLRRSALALRHRAPMVSPPWPSPSSMNNCEPGQRRCRSQAVIDGEEMSRRPWMSTPGT